MPDEAVEAEMRALTAKLKEKIAEYREATEQTLITVLQVKVQAMNDPALQYVYEAAVRKEQELTNILKAIDADILKAIDDEPACGR
jgi:hypothetical protein